MNRATLVLLAIATLLGGCATSGASRAEHMPHMPRGVRRFVELHGVNLSSLETSDTHHPEEFRRHLRFYHVDVTADVLWQTYRNIDPREAWSGPISRFGLLHQPEEDALYFQNSERLPELNENQTYLVNLRFASFAQLAAAFRITRISDKHRTIEFTYLEQNKSNGLQRITIRPHADGALIEHFSLFRSGRAFRDRVLYPPFHTRAIDEFHRHVAATIGARMRVIRGSHTS
jgi:hypothetical protein